MAGTEHNSTEGLAQNMTPSLWIAVHARGSLVAGNMWWRDLTLRSSLNSYLNAFAVSTIGQSLLDSCVAHESNTKRSSVQIFRQIATAILHQRYDSPQRIRDHGGHIQRISQVVLAGGLAERFFRETVGLLLDPDAIVVTNRGRISNAFEIVTSPEEIGLFDHFCKQFETARGEQPRLYKNSAAPIALVPRDSDVASILQAQGRQVKTIPVSMDDVREFVQNYSQKQKKAASAESIGVSQSAAEPVVMSEVIDDSAAQLVETSASNLYDDGDDMNGFTEEELALPPSIRRTLREIRGVSRDSGPGARRRKRRSKRDDW